MKKMVNNVLQVIFSIYMVLLLYIGSFLLHVYTAYIVYVNWGFFLGIISFFSPIISTVILVILFTIAGGFLNPFNIIVLIYLLCYIPYILLAIIIEKLEN